MPFIGEIRIHAFNNIIPTGWALCDGQTLTVNQNPALFNVLGNRFGGDGVTTFNLPDLRGRTPLGAGQGPGLSPRAVGDVGGTETVTLLVNNLPAHAHAFRGSAANGVSDSPAGNAIARNPAGIGTFRTPADSDMASGMILATGGNQAHNNMQPYLTVNYLIALQGTFPYNP